MNLKFFGGLVGNDFILVNSPSVAAVCTSGLFTKKMATVIFDAAANDINGFSNKVTGISSAVQTTGSGLSDLTMGGTFTSLTNATYVIKITTAGGTDYFEVSKNGGAFGSSQAITGSAQAMADGITVAFGATTGHTLNDAWTVTAVAGHPLGVYIPAGAIITKTTLQVKTAFTSTDSTATVSLTAVTLGDLYAAIAVSSNPGTPGYYAGIQDGTVTYYLGAGASVRNISANVGVEALTAGKLVAFIEYVIGL